MSTKQLLIVTTLLALSFATSEWHNKDAEVRENIDKHQGNHVMTEAHYERRRNQSLRWRNLRIFFDNSELYRVNPSRAEFYRKVFDIVGEWWGSTLQVRDDPQQAADTIQRYRRYYPDELNFDLPAGRSLTDYDLLVKVSWGNNNGRVLAYAGPRVRHPDTQRPITGITHVTPFGDENFRRANDSVNRAVGTIIHEFGHVIAFTSFDSIQSRYVATSGQTYFWTGPIVRQKAAEYYGCSSNPQGVPLYNNNGSVGGHWDEAFFHDELMTPTTGAEAEKVSAMTLALCEDTEWYRANYDAVENFEYGSNDPTRCNASSSGRHSCPSPEICTVNTAGFVTSDYKGVGYCRQDSNGCATEFKYSNRDCMQGAQWGTQYDRFGAAYGGDVAIVSGNFIRDLGRSYTRVSQICAKVECSEDHSSYTWQFSGFQRSSEGGHSGDASVTCTREGQKEFNDIGGGIPASSVTCVDPSSFCPARFGSPHDGQTSCHPSCNKNGRCRVNNGVAKCWCYADFRVTSGACPDLDEDND